MGKLNGKDVESLTVSGKTPEEVAERVAAQVGDRSIVAVNHTNYYETDGSVTHLAYVTVEKQSRQLLEG